ncbi:MAG: 1-(5-phosphoribosyl)-5-[(5-phosphoribosylamino)methylideneamino]imidazole-4-carboxamide isomerase [Alphaproteobacteria bacterium]|nr:1-(5-phosphoribosyl)-5-[(5-phosphoribosylamino)methylideneamino]imidazole-4-carboxamide isomerase [Alphaproteobacteria bacterium]
MILFPAIDLKDGKCVRLERGAMDRATVFNDNPADQARAFEAAGFRWLHLVDLNGAIEGHPVNADAVVAVLGASQLPVQLGGGIRDMRSIEMWLDRGIARVILGTVALSDPGLVREACARFPGRIVVGIDARGGHVATEGWVKTSERRAVDLAIAFEEMASDGVGPAAIIYTDIDRDGVLTGVNIEATVALAKAVSIPVIASGGVASLDDLRALKGADAPIAGVVCGRALYDGRIEPEAALKLLDEAA